MIPKLIPTPAPALSGLASGSAIFKPQLAAARNATVDTGTLSCEPNPEISFSLNPTESPAPTAAVPAARHSPVAMGLGGRWRHRFSNRFGHLAIFHHMSAKRSTLLHTRHVGKWCIPQSQWVRAHNRRVIHIAIDVHPTLHPNRVPGHIPRHFRLVIAIAVVVQCRFQVLILPLEPNRIALPLQSGSLRQRLRARI
ncbi:hypothetical protein PssiTeo3_03980 [Pseudomonas sichuanensis]|nr:hypothetical protein [Pseudomonas sichuanensis]